MAGFFKSGTEIVPTGVAGFDVTGLALGFVPTTLVARVRQPAAEGDIIDAFVAGEPTADGFSVVLSAPVPSDGYRLDWIAAADGVEPSASGGLSVGYAALREEVAAFLGYGTGDLTKAQDAEVDRYVQSGVRQFYYPPLPEGADADFSWDFLRAEGSVRLTPGVADYALPDGFTRFDGRVVLSGGGAVSVVPFAEMLRMRRAAPARTGTPRFAATLATGDFGERGQRRRLYLFPAPDAADEASFTCCDDGGPLDAASNPWPRGGAAYAELLLESCLSIAEQRANDEAGAHTAKFQSLLASAISRSRACGAQDFGRVGDPDAFEW